MFGDSSGGFGTFYRTGDFNESSRGKAASMEISQFVSRMCRQVYLRKSEDDDVTVVDDGSRTPDSTRLGDACVGRTGS